MDFPLDINKRGLVIGMDELQQTVEILLKTPKGEMLQSPTLGAEFSVHVGDVDVLEVGVRETLKQIPGVVVNSCSLQGDLVTVEITYNDEIVKFQFNIE